MTPRSLFRPGRASACLVAIVAFVTVGSAALSAQVRKSNPSSKAYVAEAGGEVLIDTGEKVQDLTKRGVYTMQGAVIETKPAKPGQDASKFSSTIVFSNGTGAYIDADTRMEVRRFVQEPFTPDRTDMDVEPSISQMRVYLSRGSVGLCTSKLVAGSTMVYETRHGSVTVRGRKVVIEAAANYTKISMIEGDSTVRAGAKDMGGHTLKSGEQAIIRPGPEGQANEIQIVPIPQDSRAATEEKAALACLAKRTVYFEERAVAFDAAASEVTTEIVAVEVVPVTLPVEYTVSPATLSASGR